jgi:hypothetical protein
MKNKIYINNKYKNINYKKLIYNILKIKNFNKFNK